MKQLLIILSLFVSCESFSQLPSIGSPLGNTIRGLLPKDFLRLPVVGTNTLNGAPDSVGYLVFNKNDSNVYKYIGGGVFRKIDSSKTATDILAAGGFTSVPTIGFNPCVNCTPAQIIQAAYYRAQPPTATLTGGLQLELIASGAGLAYTLNWSAGRTPFSKPLATIVVAGVNKSFSQPLPGSSTNGTQSVSVPRNITTTYSNVVTTVDTQTTIATTTFTFLPKRYWGTVTNNNPTDAQIIATNSELSTSRVKSFTTQSNNPYYIEYCYPASEGDLNSIKINTFESILAFTKTQRNFTNALGYISLYNIYISSNQIAVTTNTTIDVQ